MTSFQYQFIGFDAAEITNNVNFHTTKIEKILASVLESFKDLPVINVIFKKTNHSDARIECAINAGEIHVESRGEIVSQLASSAAHKLVQIVRKNKN